VARIAQSLIQPWHSYGLQAFEAAKWHLVLQQKQECYVMQRACDVQM
jgi:hypothetical protein